MTAARRRVAVTGLGLVTPLGLDVATTWEGVLAGRSGVGPISLFDAGTFPVRIGAEVRGFDVRGVLDDRRLRRGLNRSHAFALGAAEEALQDAGVRPTTATASRWGCVVGTGMSGLVWDDLADVAARAAPGGTLDAARLAIAEGAAADRNAFSRSQPAQGLAVLAQRHGIRGYASSVHTACASGGQAVGTALRVIRRGGADWMLAGGFDSMLHPIGLAGFCLLGAVSPDNHAPERASRPFDATRNGFVLGEGAGFLVLELWEAARARGAHIYAELAGDGNSLSSFRITDPHPSGDGPIQAMRAALADAGIGPDGVGYVNAHGTSTPMNDRSEAAALRAVFGAAVGRVAVSSTKSEMGHLIAAAGAVEAAICALTLDRGVLPVNANLAVSDPECDLDVVRTPGRRPPPGAVVSNSFGFGGSNSCLVLRHSEAEPARPGAGSGP